MWMMSNILVFMPRTAYQRLINRIHLTVSCPFIRVDTLVVTSEHCTVVNKLLSSGLSSPLPVPRSGKLLWLWQDVIFALLSFTSPVPTPPPLCLLVLILHYLLTTSTFTSLQEEESPENGELRRAESSPTPLKRDRSFSEHDLALLRGEMLPSFSESAQLDGAVRLRGERPRSRTLSGARPPPNYRGWYLDIDFLFVCVSKSVTA